MTTITKTINNSRFTNTVCVREDCDEPRYTRVVGEILIVMDTPYCKPHCEDFHAARMVDLEASMGG